MTCIIDNCNNKAEYGNVKDLQKIYCKEHKETEINLEEPIKIILLFYDK